LAGIVFWNVSIAEVVGFVGGICGSLIIRRMSRRRTSPTASTPQMWQDDPAVIKLMYDEAQLARSMSAATVDELRVRATGALSIVATTTAIFVAVATTTGSSEAHSSIADKPLELTALSLFFVAALAFSTILMPIIRWSFWPDISRIDFYASHGCDPDGVQMEVVNDISVAVASDAPLIKRLQWLFTAATLAFIGEVVFWIVGILYP
jgi:hypothetical protein